MKATNLEAVYLAQLKDLASVEKQLATALPKIAEAAENEQLKQLITEHYQETVEQGEKINALIEAAGAKVGRKKCKGIAGIIEEGEEVFSATGDAEAIDSLLIAAAQKAEHYEIAGYGTAVAMAQQLGKDEDRRVLEQILSQEKQADRKLSALATGSVNPGAVDDDDHRGETELTGPLQSNQSRSMTMPRRDYDDYDDRGYRPGSNRGGSNQYNYNDDYDNRGGGYGGRSEGGRRSAQMQERDEYGQFAGYSGGGGGRGRSYNDDDDDMRGGNYGRRGSSSMQDRDEYGRFTGNGGRYDQDYDNGRSGGRRYSSQMGGGRYDDEYDNRGGDGYQGRAYGGHRSAQMQERDEYGQFAGYSGGGRGGRQYDDDDGYSARGRGSSSRYGRHDYDDENSGYGRSRGGNRGGGGDYIDSAGRHYSRESWERAQEGRSLGGQHSHGGGRR